LFTVMLYSDLPLQSFGLEMEEEQPADEEGSEPRSARSRLKTLLCISPHIKRPQ